MAKHSRALILGFLTCLEVGAVPEDFPVVPDDMEVSLYARDPLVRNPCAIAFDAKGRLCVGMGPQYRSPRPDTPGDSVWILFDEDGDGTADSRKEFAGGFNSIQGLAWKGRDLYVANAPELTVVRDLDGDDEGDQYVRLYTDLGNLEHALHGLNFGPDGKLYMSKGNSKGLTQPPGRVAPKPFRDLWGVQAPGAPDFPEPVVFKKGSYRKNFHDPSDDWGRSGGVLRCDPDGSNLEIVSRGFRNPWDISFDDGFDWLGTDNDQTHGDKIFSPFYGADFGWGHPWSYDWKGDAHLPSAPSAGPLFEGSGAGVIYCGLERYPEKYRGVFLINDWLRREIYIYRPVWKGAWMQSKSGKFEIIAHAGGGRAMDKSGGRRFSPVDIEVGPDQAIYVSSWGRQYGVKMEDGKIANEGRIYRLWPKKAPPKIGAEARRKKPIGKWTIEELADDLESHLPVWRTNGQDEMIRRGPAEIRSVDAKRRKSRSYATWSLWTLGRCNPADEKLDEVLTGMIFALDGSVERHQVIRVLAHRAKVRGAHQLPDRLKLLFQLGEARTRHELILAMRQVGETRWNEELLKLLAKEDDRIVYYSAWGALMELVPAVERKALLADERPAVRRAALLSLLEEDALGDGELRPLIEDSDKATAALAAKRLGGKQGVEIRGRPLGPRPAPKPLRPVAVNPVEKIVASSGNEYRIATLEAGARLYTDRGFRIDAVPAELDGVPYLQTANNDADPESGISVVVTLRYPTTVYLADDARAEDLPRWARGKWEKTDLVIRADDPKEMRIYKREVPAGELRLGTNRDGVEARKGNYILAMVPRLLSPPPTATTAEAVLPLVKKGNAERGRGLFLSRGGAACATCHRLEGFGNVFAPDLSDIGTRADAATIVQSILEPSAAITEGFAMQVLTTRSGTSWAGIVVGETGQAIEIAMVNGSVVTVPLKDIVKRETAPVSAMPPTFAAMLAPKDVADITAYLLARKEKAKPAGAEKPAAGQVAAEPAGGKPDPLSGKQWGDKKQGFSLACHDERLEIRFDGVVIASYFYRDPGTKRPFFAHVKTPSGIQVTRNFPPIEGMDPTDHASMHPGISLGFARLNGISFWHNNAGTVVHDGLVGEPEAGKTASWSVRNKWLAPGGKLVCRETTGYQIERNKDGYLLKLDTRFAGDEDIEFGVIEEMGLAIRVATPIVVKGQKGTILGAKGGENEKGTWGKIDHWWDYYGPIGDRSVGMQLMSGNGNREVWSHSRDYGVLVANPLPVDRPANRGKKITVKRGEEFRLRFGVQVHEHARREDFDPKAAYRRYLAGLQGQK